MRHDVRMMRRLPLLAWAGVWVVLVLLSTTAVWWAISHAGSRVTSMAAPQLPTSSMTAVATTTASPTPVPTRPSTPATTRPSTHAPTHPPTPRATATRTRTTATLAVQRFWKGAPGRVTATCRLERITLDAAAPVAPGPHRPPAPSRLEGITLTPAVPADGYAVDIEGRGPEALEVEFHRSDGDTDTKVRGTCRAGEPQFTVEQD